MERLTAFEFISPTDDPQMVVLKVGDVIVQAFGMVTWVGTVFDDPILCETRNDLVIEGQGLGRPYWNGEVPAWATHFDAFAQARQIAAIRTAAQREVNRVLIAQ